LFIFTGAIAVHGIPIVSKILLDAVILPWGKFLLATLAIDIAFALAIALDLNDAPGGGFEFMVQGFLKVGIIELKSSLLQLCRKHKATFQ